jgi:hypothetical protein
MLGNNKMKSSIRSSLNGYYLCSYIGLLEEFTSTPGWTFGATED